MQACKYGLVDYLPDNYGEVWHIFIGYTTIYFQACRGTWAVGSKFVIILAILSTLFGCFERLRVVQSFAYIATMIREVINDL